ncbi:MAG: hypothetical protein P8R04_04595 [Gammaproteobacteria bacterium]|jgi:hypothetical protein|nr:hypothetical protein [Gammaproteobacteria bacterium]
MSAGLSGVADMLKSDVGNSFTRAAELVDSYWRVVEFAEANYSFC